MIKSRGVAVSAVVFGAVLPLVPACLDEHTESAVAPLGESVIAIDDGGYDYTTLCGTDGGPDCQQGWCMNAADTCPTGYFAICDPLLATTACVAELPPPPLPTVCPIVIIDGDADQAALAPTAQADSNAGALEPVANGDAQDMTGWVDPLGDKGKVKIKTSDGSLTGKYTVVKKTKDEIEIKITGGGLAADFDPNDPLVIRLYNSCGKQKYSSTGTVRIIGGKRVSLKSGPDDVDVSRGAGGVITIKQGGQTITITPKPGNAGATLDGGGAKMDFTKQ
jgi:hypothetical protein